MSKVGGEKMRVGQGDEEANEQGSKGEGGIQLFSNGVYRMSCVDHAPAAGASHVSS